MVKPEKTKAALTRSIAKRKRKKGNLQQLQLPKQLHSSHTTTPWCVLWPCWAVPVWCADCSPVPEGWVTSTSPNKGGDVLACGRRHHWGNFSAGTEHNDYITCSTLNVKKIKKHFKKCLPHNVFIKRVLNVNINVGRDFKVAEVIYYSVFDPERTSK